jgi:hypothetical protein
MKKLTDPFEIEQYKQELEQQRLKEQKQNNDYDYGFDGLPEKCDDCGSFINSHGHCPRCDY